MGTQQNDQLSAPVLSLVKQYGLGELRAEFPRRESSARVRSIPVTFVASLCALLLLTLLLRLWLFVWLLGMLLVSAGITQMWVKGQIKKLDRSHLYVFVAGFIYQDVHQYLTFRWEEIGEVSQSVHRVTDTTGRDHRRTDYALTVQRGDGSGGLAYKKSVELTGPANDLVAVGGMIVSEVTRAKRGKALAALEADRSLSFGALCLDRRGLSNGKETLTWPEIRSLDVRQGALSVWKEGKRMPWFASPVGSVPNLELFLEVVGMLRDQAHSTDSARGR